jgi:hypothetical protein
MQNIERFVSAKVAAEYLSISRRHLLILAREGIKGAYPVGGRLRHRWVFKLSELSQAIDPRLRYPPYGIGAKKELPGCCATGSARRTEDGLNITCQ